MLDFIGSIKIWYNSLVTAIFFLVAFCFLFYFNLNYQLTTLNKISLIKFTSKPIYIAPPQAIQPIYQWHLFGVYNEIKANEHEVAKVTHLPLILVGILATGDDGSGSAIIGNKNTGAEKIYDVGDTLPGEAKLIHVYTDRVIISYYGKIQAIVLPKLGEETNQ